MYCGITLIAYCCCVVTLWCWYRYAVVLYVLYTVWLIVTCGVVTIQLIVVFTISGRKYWSTY